MLPAHSKESGPRREAVNIFIVVAFLIVILLLAALVAAVSRIHDRFDAFEAAALSSVNADVNKPR